MQVGTQDGWLRLPMSPVRALMRTSLTTLGTVSPVPPSRRPDSLATKLALSKAFYLLNTSGNTNGGGKGKNPHTNHLISPSAYNTLKWLVPTCPNPCWLQLRVHCHLMGGCVMDVPLPTNTHGVERSVPRILKAALAQRALAPRAQHGSAAAPCGRERQWQLRTARSGTALGSRGRADGSPWSGTHLSRERRSSWLRRSRPLLAAPSPEEALCAQRTCWAGQKHQPEPERMRGLWTQWMPLQPWPVSTASGPHKTTGERGCVVKPKLLALVGRETEHRTLKRNTKGAVSLLYPDKSHSIRTGMISKLRYSQIHRYLHSTLRTTSRNFLFFPHFLNSERKKKWKAISPLFVLRYSHCEVSEEAVTKSSYVSPWASVCQSSSKN